MPRSAPDFSASSISSRCSRASDPWWAFTRSSPANSFSCAARRSAIRRAFTNRIVERCWRMSSSSLGWIEGQIDEWSAAGPALVEVSPAPLPTSDMSATGTTTLRSIGLR